MKAKIQMTITRVIELEHEHYAGMPYEERLRQEINWANSLSHEWMEVEEAQWQTTGALFKDDVKDNCPDCNETWVECPGCEILFCPNCHMLENDAVYDAEGTES